MSRAKHPKPTPELHAGSCRGRALWHSDDGGETWWSGGVLALAVNVTRRELVEMARSVIESLTDEAGRIPPRKV